MGLTVSHLHKKYGEKTVVEDLSFSMEKPLCWVQTVPEKRHPFA